MRVSFDMSKFQDDYVDRYMFSNVALLVWGQESKAIKLKEKRTWKSFIGKHLSVRRLREICDLRCSVGQDRRLKTYSPVCSSSRTCVTIHKIRWSIVSSNTNVQLYIAAIWRETIQICTRILTGSIWMLLSADVIVNTDWLKLIRK